MIPRSSSVPAADSALTPRIRRRAWTGQQVARRVLRARVRGERPATGHVFEHDTTVAGRVVLFKQSQRCTDLVDLGLSGIGERLDGDRLRREEEQRLDGALELRDALRVRLVTHAARSRARAGPACTWMSANGASCAQVSSPCL